jgi:5-methylcytosine-specific restriction endonuclease McrA
MILIDEDLLEAFRHAPNCEVCGAINVHGLDPHHLLSRGAGRVDHPRNLIALCRKCHRRHHAALVPTRKELFEIVAKREGCSIEMISETVWRIRRLPKS